jgi:hypothetical protein
MTADRRLRAVASLHGLAVGDALRVVPLTGLGRLRDASVAGGARWRVSDICWPQVGGLSTVWPSDQPYRNLETTRVISVTSNPTTTTLWRPTGPRELELVRELGWRAWPPRLPEQPIFYPVLNEDYAIKIARDWNVNHDGAGYVTRFEVDSAFLARYPVQQAGGQNILELWVPAEELDEFNDHIVGQIKVVHEFH